jgi:hypothetical protein
MKPLAKALLAITAIAFIGACDSHSWESTKGLHNKPAIKSGGHDEGHGAAHGEAAKEGHAAPAAEHK